jgi:trehalose 6-phosphate phosphatase
VNSFRQRFEQRLSGDPLVVMLDVDGTLSAIAPRPEDAVVPAETKRTIAALASRAGVHVALVSGRGATDARRLVGVANVWVVGNHGAEVMSPTGDIDVDPQVAPFGSAMAQLSRRLTQLTSAVPGVSVEDKTWTLSIHFRLADPGVVPRLRGAVQDAVRRSGLRMFEGKKILEVRPPVRVDKGTAVLALADRLGGFADGASLMFAGDDTTDEDAFRVLRARDRRSVTIRVADAESPETSAEFTLHGVGEMRSMLEWLATLRK